MIRILIVEDDENIAKMIAATLTMGGYQSDICDNGMDAVKHLDSGEYDLALLDIMLPGMDGFSVLQQVSATPVIFLTAMQDVSDKVKGLRLGAEDYMIKPFEAVELLARIEVVLRRSNKGKKELVYEDLVVNLDAHTVKKGDRFLSLTPKEFDVLVFFLQNPDIALTRERLLSSIWGYEFEGESRTVDIHVQQVRRKTGLQNRLITIPKLGYRLESQGRR